MKAPAAARGVLPWLIGLFALWQLAFVPLANLMEFVPLRQTAADLNHPIESTQRWGTFTSNETLQSSAESAGNVLAFWAEATGQEHGWNMFTPGFPPYTVVPVVEFRNADGKVVHRVDSRFDPIAHPIRFLRTPMIRDREFNNEANIVMLFWDYTPRDYAQRPELLATVPKKVRENSELIEQFIRMHYRRYLREIWSSSGPAGAILSLRYISNANPSNVVEMPFARLRFSQPRVTEVMVLEGYDPSTKQFVPLPVWEQP